MTPAVGSPPSWSSFGEYLTAGGDSCSRGAVEALSAAAAEVKSSFHQQAPYSPSNPQSPQQQQQEKERRGRSSGGGGQAFFFSKKPWGPTHSASFSSGDDERGGKSANSSTSTTGRDNLSSSSAERGEGGENGRRAPRGTNPLGGAATSLSSSQQREGPSSSTTPHGADPTHNEPRWGRTKNGDRATNTAMNDFWERAGSISRKLSFEVIEQACLAVHCQSPAAAKSATAPAAESSTTAATASLTTTQQQPQTPNNNNNASSSSSPSNELAQAKQWALNASLHTPPEGGTVSHHTTSPPSPNPNAPKTAGNSTITTDLPQHHKQAKLARQHDEIEVLPNHRVQVRLPPTHPGDAPKKAKGVGSPPVDTLLVNICNHLERSISELTMRSSYAATCESLNKLPDNRRMAYYAVGKHHRPASTSSNASHPLAAQLNRTGCNRRCYFTGKLILGGAVFYAGTVQQGLRTLVVFCLPYALGLPDKELCKNAPTRAVSVSGASSTASPRHHLGLGGMFQRSEPSRASSKNSSSVAGGGRQPQPSRGRPAALSSNSTVANHSVANHSVANYSTASNQQSLRSRFSNSLDGDVSTIDCDLDPNWGLDTDFLLKVLPEAGPELVAQMSRQYPDQFATLPLQVRDPAHWKLYVKFCFFSGLPIAEGEMHYKVLDRIAELVYDGEEITLSHEVMEAVNGSESAEILTLPNQKAFRYLRKHYAQQCAKLDDRVFRRDSWERIAPEV